MTYNVSNLDTNTAVVTIINQGEQGADAVLQAGNRGDFTVAIAGNGSQTATINSGAVTSDKILDGTILNADINASAGILGTKISPNFGSQNITTTGNIAGAAGTFSNDLSLISNIPTINLTSTISDSDYRIQNYSGIFTIKDVTNGSNRLEIASDGTANFSGNLDVGAGLDITGDITVTGLVDSVDIAARDTLFGGLTSSSGVLTNGVTATTQSAGDNSLKVATTAYTDTAISILVDSSPAALNTLNELAAALGDDANFSTTVTNSIATKLSLSGGTIDGNVKFNDGKNLFFGTDNDLKIKHSGALADIVNTRGNLRLETSTGNNILFRTENNGSHTNLIVCNGTTGSEHVDLYHSSNRRLSTTNGGAQVIGILKAGGEGDLPSINTVTRAIFSGPFDNTNDSQNSSSAISILCKGTANSRINLGTETNENQAQIKYRHGNNNDIQFLVTDPSDNNHNVQLEINADSILLNYLGAKKAETSATGFDVTGLLTANNGLTVSSGTTTLANSVTLNGTSPNILFSDTDAVLDYRIQVNSGALQFKGEEDTSSGTTFEDKLSINSTNVTVHKDLIVSGFINTTHSTNGYSLFKTEDAGSGLKIASKTATAASTLVFSNNHSGTLANNWFVQGQSNGSTYAFTVGKGNIDGTTATPMLQIGDAVILNYANTVNGSFSTKAQTSSTGFEVLGDLKLTGDISSEDKFITLANIATPTDTQAANSGLYIKGNTDKHFRYQNGNNSFNSSENITIAADKKLRFQSKLEIFNSSGIGDTAADFDSTANYSQNDYVKSGNKIYQAQAAISAGGTAPTHANHIENNWLFVRIDDGEAGQYIVDASTGPLKLLTSTLAVKNTNDNKTSANFIPNGAVHLFYNNVQKLSTLNTGIRVKGGILFNDDTADANTLDDYETGTFTPTLEGSSSNPTVNYRNTTTGHYTKIGNVVYIQVQVDINSYSGGGGEWQMGGLPFTTSASATASFNFNWNQNNRVSWSTNTLSLGIYASSNNNHLRARQFGNNLNTSLNLSAFDNGNRLIFGVFGSYIAA